MSRLYPFEPPVFVVDLVDHVGKPTLSPPLLGEAASTVVPQWFLPSTKNHSTIVALSKV
jgi:hypothetical protein